MPVQDLTPQLRTRLSRLEKWVGVFVTFATLLMIGGLAYYVYVTAQRKGWFVTKAPYYTWLHSGAGLKVGDTVKLMGFDVGDITKITAAPPFSYDDSGNMVDVYVQFEVRSPYYGYVWSDSVVKVKSAGLLGNRFLEVTKGGTSGTTNKLYATYKENEKSDKLTEILVDPKTGRYKDFAKGAIYGLPSDEPPELSAQLDEVVRTAKNALPGIFELTNKLTQVLTNASMATENLSDVLVSVKPAMSNLNAVVTNTAVITAHLREPKGSLGEWILPTNIHQQVTLLLTNANTAVTNVNTNLVTLVENLNRSLESLAGITSNLHAQVNANTNIVSEVSTIIVDADDFIQGLKHHWLFRSAFKHEQKPTGTNAVPQPVQSPKGKSVFP